MPKNISVTFTETPPLKPAVVAAPAPDNDPPPTPQEIEARHKALAKSMGWDMPPEPAPPVATPDPTPAPAPVTPPPAPAPEPTPAPAPAPVAAPAPTQVVTMATPEQIREAATVAAREAVRSTQPPAPAQPSAPAFEMTDDDREDYEVVQFLERSEPKKYAGAADRFLAYVKALYAYQDDWAKKNEGKDFDPDDDEHATFYAENNPGVTERDIKRGYPRMIAEQAALNAVKPQLDKVSQQRARESAMPSIIASIHRSIVSLVDQVDSALKNHITDGSGNPLLAKANVEALEAASPIAARHLRAVIKNRLEPMLYSLEMSSTPDTGYELNPAGDMAHRELGAFVHALEQQRLKLPATERQRGGREFITISQLGNRIAEIESGNASHADKQRQIAELDSRFYTVGTDEIAQFIVSELAKEAKENIQSDREIAKREFGSAPAVVQPEPVLPTTPSPAPVHAGVNGKPNPPSLNSPIDTVRQNDQLRDPQKSDGEKMLAIHFRK